MEVGTVLQVVFVLAVLMIAWYVLRLDRRLGWLGSKPADGLETLQREIQAVRSGVDERLRENLQQSQELSRQIGELRIAAAQVEQLSAGLVELRRVLQPAQTRGAFGERLLEDALGDALPRQRFCMQYTYPKSGVRVDAVVRLAAGQLLPIDCKFPLDNLRRYLERRGSDEAAAEAARRAFVRDVKRHIDDVAAKYISPLDGTLDLALLYIPSEAVYYEITAGPVNVDDAPVSDYALKKRVVPVSASMLQAYLSVVRMGLQGYQLGEGAREVLRQLSQLRTDAEGTHTELGRAIRQARHSLANLSAAERALARLLLRLQTISGDGNGGGEPGLAPEAEDATVAADPAGP